MTENKSNELFKTGLWVFIFTLILRFVAFLIATPTLVNVDEFYYLSRGKMIVDGWIPYTDFMFWHPPGALLIFSLQHFLLKNAWILSRIVSILVDSCNAYLIFRACATLFNRRAGVFSALIYVTNPISILTNTAAMSETYNLLMILTAVNLLLKEKPKIFLAGFCFAFSFFIKYYTLFLIVLPLLYFTYKNRESRKLLVYTPIFFIIFLLMTVQDYKTSSSKLSLTRRGMRVKAITTNYMRCYCFSCLCNLT